MQRLLIFPRSSHLTVQSNCHPNDFFTPSSLFLSIPLSLSPSLSLLGLVVVSQQNGVGVMTDNTSPSSAACDEYDTVIFVFSSQLHPDTSPIEGSFPNVTSPSPLAGLCVLNPENTSFFKCSFYHYFGNRRNIHLNINIYVSVWIQLTETCRVLRVTLLHLFLSADTWLRLCPQPQAHSPAVKRHQGPLL